MKKRAAVLLTALFVGATSGVVARNDDPIASGAGPGAVSRPVPKLHAQITQGRPDTPDQPLQASGRTLVNDAEVFISVGTRKTEKLAIAFAQEYYRDFRSASAAFLGDGRWVALIGWTDRAGAPALLQELRQAGRIPYGSFTLTGNQVETITWSASKSLDREALRIPGNIRRSSILQGLGIAGTWGATPAACSAGFNRDDLLDGTLQIGARDFVWGSFGRCSLGSMVRVGGGLFVGASCGNGNSQEKFVLSLRRRGPKLEVITDPVKDSKIYYQFDWCPRQGVAAVRPGGAPQTPRVARAPDPPRASPPRAPGSEPSRKARSTGSGFFVSSAGHLVTNDHVVRTCEEVFVKGFGRAQVVRQDSQNDLALLKLRTEKAVPFLRMRTEPIQLGQEIVVFGYPLSSILNNGLNVTTGIISSETGMRNDQRMLQFSAAIQPGNSGGPVVDRTGNLVAVVRSKFSDKFALDRGNFVPQNLNYGIRTNILETFLNGNGVSIQKAPAGKERSVADLAAAAKAHTMLVTCH